MATSKPIRPPSPRSIALEYRTIETRPGELERADRATNSLNLNFLKDEAGRIMHKKAVDIFRIAQGGFNQAISVVFDDGSDIIARVNCSPVNDLSDHDNESLERTVASEFAVLKLLRQETTIPVPTVYAVNWKTDNPVGNRYMLQERVRDGLLSEYPQLVSLLIQIIGKYGLHVQTPEETAQFMTQLIEYESQLLNLQFPKIGCPIPDSDLKASRENVGPLVHPFVPLYAPPSLQGPFETSLEYLQAKAGVEYNLVTNRTELWKSWRKKYKLLNQDPEEVPFNFFEQFYRLFRKSLDTMQFDCEFPFVLVNPDMNDVFVSWEDPTRIIAVIDWESSAAMPLWAVVSFERHIRGWFADEKTADIWCETRKKHLESTVPRFKEALESESCRVQRNLYRLLGVYSSIVYSPKALSQMFLESYENWPNDARHAFKELVQLLHDHGFSSSEKT